MRKPRFKTAENGMRALSNFLLKPRHKKHGLGWWALQYNGSGYWHVVPYWWLPYPRNHVFVGEGGGAGTKSALAAVRRVFNKAWADYKAREAE
ncbi:MAG: hypothetical protein V3W44_05070 [Dehalococcoidales bacterium]